ncbi:MAG: hypothetical protein ACK6DZ_23185 [Acidobacteriota bacterium]
MGTADFFYMKALALFVGLILTMPGFARKPKTLMSKPASRPPVYKKFNHKEKKPMMKWGSTRKK